MSSDLRRVLCVDDEQSVLDGLRRNLRRTFDLETALGPIEGLERLESAPGFHVIVSDLRMPKMNGLEFLEEAKRRAPESTRMLLTGDADLGSAIEAVNQGNVFHFLQKPCPKEVLVSAIERAIDHHDLVVGQRELLEKTLLGAVSMLVEALEIQDADTFGSARAVGSTAREVARRLDIPQPWKLELAALLAQTAYVTLPDGLLARLADGDPLSQEEQETVSRLDEVAIRLLDHIPRIDDVKRWIEAQGPPWGVDEERSKPDEVGDEAAVLRISLDSGILLSSGMPFQLVQDVLSDRAERYGERVACAFAGITPDEEQQVVREVRARELVAGMILMKPVHDIDGRMLLKSGQVVSAGLRERLMNFARNGNLKEPLVAGVTQQ